MFTYYISRLGVREEDCGAMSKCRQALKIQNILTLRELGTYYLAPLISKPLIEKRSIRACKVVREEEKEEL
jgi:hypothetical protein